MINTRRAVNNPDKAPDAMPSPDIRTAAIPPKSELRYNAQSDNGVVNDAGSVVEYAMAQKINKSNTAEIIHAI